MARKSLRTAPNDSDIHGLFTVATVLDSGHSLLQLLWCAVVDNEQREESPDSETILAFLRNPQAEAGGHLHQIQTQRSALEALHEQAQSTLVELQQVLKDVRGADQEALSKVAAVEVAANQAQTRIGELSAQIESEGSAVRRAREPPQRIDLLRTISSGG